MKKTVEHYVTNYNEITLYANFWVNQSYTKNIIHLVHLIVMYWKYLLSYTMFIDTLKNIFLKSGIYCEEIVYNWNTNTF